jgi:hypothetical protein
MIAVAITVVHSSVEMMEYVNRSGSIRINGAHRAGEKRRGDGVQVGNSFTYLLCAATGTKNWT